MLSVHLFQNLLASVISLVLLPTLQTEAANCSDYLTVNMVSHTQARNVINTAVRTSNLAE